MSKFTKKCMSCRTAVRHAIHFFVNQSIVANPIIYTLVPSPSRYEIRQWVHFLMVIMASGIARGRVRTTTRTAAELPNMAAILQKKRHSALVYRLLLWYWTSMLWSIDTCQNKVSADKYCVFISRAQVYSSSRLHVFVKLIGDEVLGFRLDCGLMSG